MKYAGRRLVVLAVIAGSMLPGALAASAAETGKHLFILSGQSNMAGLKHEASFTPVVNRAFGVDRVLVVKDAHGGQSIRSWARSNHEFPAPTTGRVPKVRGELYGRLIKKVKTAIEGHPLQTVTFVWMQGESDLNNTAYDAYLKELLEQLQADLAFEEIHVVIGRISDYHLDVEKRLAGRLNIRRVQQAFAEAHPRGAWIDTDDLNDKKVGDQIVNDLHYTAAGYQILGKRFAEQAIALIEKPVPTLDVQCPPVFGDRAVFQQGIPVPVWGITLPGAKVTVEFDTQSKVAKAGVDGAWRVTLDSLGADKLKSLDQNPEGRTLTLTSEIGGKRARRTFGNILVGEVWLCSGQSNMAGKVRHNRANQDPNDDLMKSNLPTIRHVSAPDDWQPATPEFVGEFTRVGFCFARRVHAEIKTPIGLVNACRGGSRIESWMRVPPPNLAESDRKVEYGSLYRERIEPLVGYGLRGMLWYQGEANASEGKSYFLKMESMIADWRAEWKQVPSASSGQELPFHIVQLAGIGRPVPDRPTMGDGRARIREAQRKVLTLPNTGMAVAIDIGGDREHPGNKAEVGERLAHWALHHDYGLKEIVPSGPLYRGFEVEGGSIRIRFDHAQGLMTATKTDYVPPEPAPGAKIPWLSIRDRDGIWHWADGVIDGSDLIVSSRAVTHPVEVRYAFTNRPLGVYLYNAAGLPASPFTTETEGPALVKP